MSGHAGKIIPSKIPYTQRWTFTSALGAAETSFIYNKGLLHPGRLIQALPYFFPTPSFFSKSHLFSLQNIENVFEGIKKAEMELSSIYGLIVILSEELEKNPQVT